MFSRRVVCVLLVFVCVVVSNACERCVCLSYQFPRTQCAFKTTDKVLTEIPDSLPANSTLLEMNKQPLKSLGAHVFTKVKLSLLEVIELEYCIIKSIHKDAFNGVYNLSRLSLQYNEIESLDPNVFGTNKNLSIVELSFNKLTVISNGLFSNLSSLKSVDLHKNLIRYVEEYAFYNNPDLFTINLQYNQLQMIEASMVDRLKALTHLLIDNNDWQCHCGLRKLREVMAKRNLYDRTAPMCSSPVSVSFKFWQFLTWDKFVCWLTVDAQNINRTTYDEQVQLDCTFNGNPNVHAINWTYHGNETILNDEKYRIYNYYDWKTEVNKTYLNIKNLTPADSGVYTCTGTNYAGSANLTHNLTVFIGTPPQTTVLTKPVIEVDESTKNITLPCKVFGIPKPRMSWRTLQNTVRAGSNHIISEETAEQDHYWYNLTFTRVHQYSAAIYTCTGNNSRGSDAKAVQIIVRYLPTVRVKFQVSDDRKRATVTCNVEAYPTPKIKWQRNNLDMDTQSSQKYSTVTTLDLSKSNTFNTVLQIYDLLPSDKGEYQCVAENSLGTRLDNIYLTFPHVPIIALPKENTVFVAKSNEQTTIQCLVAGSPSNVYWVRNGKDLRKEAGKYLLSTGSGQEYWCNLTIFTIDESDTGQYQCVAENYLGFATQTVIFKVTGLANRVGVIIWISVILVIIIALVALSLKRYCNKPQCCVMAQDAEIEKTENYMNRTEDEESNTTCVNPISQENQTEDQIIQLNQSLNSNEESNTACVNQGTSS